MEGTAVKPTRIVHTIDDDLRNYRDGKPSSLSPGTLPRDRPDRTERIQWMRDWAKQHKRDVSKGILNKRSKIVRR